MVNDSGKIVKAKLGIMDRLKLVLNPVALELLEDQLTKFQKEDEFYKSKYTRMCSFIRETKLSAHKEKHILTVTYNKTVRAKHDVFRQVEEVRNNYLYSGIVNLLVEDALAPSIVTNDIVEISSKKGKLNTSLEKLQETFDFDELIKVIVGDLLAFGEYGLSLSVDGTEKKPGAGITAITDNIDQSRMVALYEGTLPSRFIMLDEKGKKLEAREPYEVAHFIIGDRKLRLKIDGQQSTEYVRVGRPLFWGTFDLIKNLILMTALIPASYLQKINNSSIIGLTVAEGTAPQQAFQIAQQFQTLLNKAVTFDKTTGDVTVTDVLNMAGRFKVIPQYGEKGNMTKIDPRFEEITDLSVIEDLRKAIMSSIGIPYTFLFGEGQSKGETLKTFSRYVRKLHNLQSAIGYGLKQIALAHLNNSGNPAKIDDIEVKFSNTLVNIEDLDKVEFIDTLISTLGNLAETVNAISENIDAETNKVVLKKFLERFLKPVNLEKLFILKKADGEEEEEEEEEEPTPPEPDDDDDGEEEVDVEDDEEEEGDEE